MTRPAKKRPPCWMCGGRRDLPFVLTMPDGEVERICVKCVEFMVRHRTLPAEALR